MKPISMVGVVVALLGLLFTLQGFNVLKGSAMSNTATWSILGPIILIVGIGLVAFGRRKTS